MAYHLWLVPYELIPVSDMIGSVFDDGEISAVRSEWRVWGKQKAILIVEQKNADVATLEAANPRATHIGNANDDASALKAVPGARKFIEAQGFTVTQAKWNRIKNMSLKAFFRKFLKYKRDDGTALEVDYYLTKPRPFHVLRVGRNDWDEL